MFMFFWKERQCLPNYAELKIIMVHKDKNGKSDVGRSCRHHRQTYLGVICTISFIDFETLWKLKSQTQKWKMWWESIPGWRLDPYWTIAEGTVTWQLLLLLCCFQIPFTFLVYSSLTLSTESKVTPPKHVVSSKRFTASQPFSEFKWTQNWERQIDNQPSTTNVHCKKKRHILYTVLYIISSKLDCVFQCLTTEMWSSSSRQSCV